VYTVHDSRAKTAAHAVLAAVLQVRDGALQALLWQRARDPHAGAWALPGGVLEADETLEESMRRHLAEKVDVRELSHLEQLETRSDPDRNPAGRELATAFLGLVPSSADPDVPDDTHWHPFEHLPALAYDHRPILLAARERLRGKLSYTNLGFALAPEAFTMAELRDLYAAALGHPVSATNLQRVLLRRGLLEGTGERRRYGGTGGRPAALYRFRARELEITDQFAVLRPPTMTR
jgi:ADP-ribose pyrophosphatase YjhB (NUDIX family)